MCPDRECNRHVLPQYSGGPFSDEKPHSCLFKIPGIHRGGSKNFCAESASHHKVNFAKPVPIWTVGTWFKANRSSVSSVEDAVRNGLTRRCLLIDLPAAEEVK